MNRNAIPYIKKGMTSCRQPNNAGQTPFRDAVRYKAAIVETIRDLSVPFTFFLQCQTPTATNRCPAAYPLFFVIQIIVVSLVQAHRSALIRTAVKRLLLLHRHPATHNLGTPNTSLSLSTSPPNLPCLLLPSDYASSLGTPHLHSLTALLQRLTAGHVLHRHF